MENIRAMQEILEQLYALSSPFGIFLEKYLGKIVQHGWWQQCVIDKLNNHKKASNWHCDPQKITDLDISQMIQVLLDNWKELQNLYRHDIKIFNNENHNLAIKVRYLRNEIAHQKYSPGKDLQKYNMDCDILEEFSRFIETDMETCIHELHKKEKLKILRIITEKVLIPAMQSSIVDEKTKASVKDTFKRLEETKRAREIVDFFFSALKGIRGKEICKHLRSYGLKAFEDIEEDIKLVYFGNNY